MVSGTKTAGIGVTLRSCTLAYACSTAATSNTNTYGRYVFSGMPALDASHLYLVQYVLTSPTECATRMNAYIGADIAPYPVAGAVVHSDDFDVASFNQIDPSGGGRLTCRTTSNGIPGLKIRRWLRPTT